VFGMIRGRERPGLAEGGACCWLAGWMAWGMAVRARLGGCADG
jgi:hypothetical protein